MLDGCHNCGFIPHDLSNISRKRVRLFCYVIWLSFIFDEVSFRFKTRSFNLRKIASLLIVRYDNNDNYNNKIIIKKKYEKDNNSNIKMATSIESKCDNNINSNTSLMVRESTKSENFTMKFMMKKKI